MNIREEAVKIITKVNEGAYLNITLNHFLMTNDISIVDANLLTRLCYGYKMHQMTLEYGIKKYCGDIKLRNFEKTVLMLAYLQMVYFDKIPDYAICNDAVEMVKKKRGPKTAGFINANLKKLLKHKEIEIECEDELEYLSIEYSHPLWLVKMLNKQYGLETLKKILVQNQQPPLISGRVNTLKISRDDLLAKDPLLKKGAIGFNSVIYPSGNLANTSYYKEGLMTVQDTSSQLVAELLNPKKDSFVLDMCSAPGSKTTHLSAIMNNTGIIHAYDLFEHKIPLIQSNCDRLGCTNIQAKAYDSTKLLEIEKENSFDSILLDGPCSGLGVLQRKPEIRYHDSSVMDSLLPLQQELLEVAYKLLKVGGEMVYSTCTINKKENEKNIERFTKNHPNMKIVEEKTILGFEYESDGFYMVKLVKEDEEKHI